MIRAPDSLLRLSGAFLLFSILNVHMLYLARVTVMSNCIYDTLIMYGLL